MSRSEQANPRIKVEWADQHIEHLATGVNAFIESDPYGIIENPNSHTAADRYTISVVRPLPAELNCLTGDILHNLRSALDHLIYRIMPDTVSWERFHCFPIMSSANEYEAQKRWKRSKIKGLPAALVQRIDALKPYRGGSDALWRLHELNNIDKHRLLVTVGLAQHETWIQGNPFFAPRYFPPSYFLWAAKRRTATNMVSDGAVIVPPTDPSNMDAKRKYAVVVALNEPQMGVIRFGGHLSYEEYDVQTDGRHPQATSASHVHR